jgi:hypothetical protein
MFSTRAIWKKSFGWPWPVQMTVGSMRTGTAKPPLASVVMFSAVRASRTASSARPSSGVKYAAPPRTFW